MDLNQSSPSAHPMAPPSYLPAYHDDEARLRGVDDIFLARRGQGTEEVQHYRRRYRNEELSTSEGCWSTPLGALGGRDRGRRSGLLNTIPCATPSTYRHQNIILRRLTTHLHQILLTSLGRH